MFKNLVITAILGAAAVILGAFGAHSLEDVLTIAELKSFETAVRYQMFHVLVLLFLNTYQGFTEIQKNRLSLLYFFGIACFSGSIYLIQLTQITAKSIWFITPLGGLFFITGWSYLIVLFIKKAREK